MRKREKQQKEKSVPFRRHREKPIVGYEKEKKEIFGLQKMLKESQKYQEVGVRIPRGLLISGEPGVGKTELAYLLLDDDIHLLEMSVANCNPENPVADVHAVFSIAKELAPSVVLFDSLDKLVGPEVMALTSNGAIRAAIQKEMDALTERDRVLVVATCNEARYVGDDLIRPGRFDRHIIMEAPDEKTRKKILQFYFDGLKLEKQIFLDELAKMTSGFTGAQLECVVNEVGIKTLENEKPYVDQEDVVNVMKRIQFCCGADEVLEDKEKLHKIAVHEGGHALVALLTNPDNLFGASVISQGNANGYIHYCGDERINTVEEEEQEIMVLLGGHVAEKIVLGEYLTGSSADIERAVLRLHYLTCKEAAYGYEAVCAGLLGPRSEMVPEEAKTNLNHILTQKLQKLDLRVRELIYDHCHLYSAIVGELEEKHSLSRDEILAIYDRVNEEEQNINVA